MRWLILMCALWPAVAAAEKDGMRVEAKLSPVDFAGDQPQEVTLELRLINDGARPRVIHVEAALWSAMLGWSGPMWLVEAHAPGDDAAVRRVGYAPFSAGPPGIPPSAEYFKGAAHPLAAGAAVTTTRPACFLPRAGKRGGVLVLDAHCAEAAEQRGRVVVKLDPGVTLTFGYREQPWKPWFVPAEPFVAATSAPITP